MRITAKQLRRLFGQCLATAACGLALTGIATAQVPNGSSFNIHDPYPFGENPFRAANSAQGSTSIDPSVAAAQFNELIPEPANEANMNPDLSDSSVGSVGSSGPMIDVPTGRESGMVTGPELPTTEGFATGQIVSEFDPQITADESALLYSSSSWFRRGFWYSQQEFTMMYRGQVDEVILAVNFDNTTSTFNRNVLTMADAPLTYEPGVRLTLGRFLGQDVVNRDHAIEFTFFGLMEHSGDGALESPGIVTTALDGGSDYIAQPLGGQPFSIFTPSANVPGFFLVDRQTVSYMTKLNSMEFNLKILGRPRRDRIALQPSGTWVRHASTSRIASGSIGLRGVSLGEHLRISSFDNGEQLAEYNIRTANDMYGVQCGVEVAEYYADWSWGVRFKGAGLINFADRHDAVDVFGDATPARFNKETDEQLAVLLEAGIGSSYHISPNFTGRIGYDFMYITGIAAAPNNASLAPAFSRFEVTNDAYYHGLTLGFEMLW